VGAARVRLSCWRLLVAVALICVGWTVPVRAQLPNDDTAEERTAGDTPEERTEAEVQHEAPPPESKVRDSGFAGPIELQDTFLPAQLRPQGYAESAEVLPKGGIALRGVVDWTNHLAQTDRYTFDGESITATLRMRYAPWDRVELGVDVPYVSRFEGTLDPFIEDVETALDAEVRTRFERPRDEWDAIAVRADGSRTLQMDEDDDFGDVSLRAKYALARDAHGFDVAAVGSLGLPTGGDTFGGEGVTPGLGLHAQRPFQSIHLNVYGGATLQHHTDATEQDFRLAPWRWMTYAGVEWKPAEWVGLLAAYQLYSPLARVDDPLDDYAHYYAGGVRFYLPRDVTLEATVVENMGAIENRNSSDVSFHFAVGWRFTP
jgi:hypothetical protein